MKKQIVFILLMIIALPTMASEIDIDTDGDGLTDELEISRYYLDPNSADTDGDGYEDNLELRNGYSPHFGGGKRLKEVDQDGDGLSDGWELAFGADLRNLDTDSDGYWDGEEVAYDYDPTSTSTKKLEKRLEVYLSRQRLAYFLGQAKLGEMVISSGKTGTPTPLGEFKIDKKKERAWSKAAALWMPYWLSFYQGVYAIHELPEWPSGAKEGEKHLGMPVSHGCIRLGVDDAKWLYNWTSVGTRLKISD